MSTWWTLSSWSRLARASARLARDPVERSSSTSTAWPSASRRSTRVDPMKPAPPVTSAFIGATSTEPASTVARGHRHHGARADDRRRDRPPRRRRRSSPTTRRPITAPGSHGPRRPTSTTAPGPIQDVVTVPSTVAERSMPSSASPHSAEQVEVGLEVAWRGCRRRSSRCRRRTRRARRPRRWRGT